MNFKNEADEKLSMRKMTSGREGVKIRVYSVYFFHLNSSFFIVS